MVNAIFVTCGQHKTESSQTVHHMQTATPANMAASSNHEETNSVARL